MCPSGVCLNLVSQYHDALSLELQEVLSVDPMYITPNLVSLTDRATQLDALHTLQWAAVCHYNIQKAQEKLVACTVHNRKLKHLPSALTAQFSVAPSINPHAPPIDNTRRTPVTLSVPSGHLDDISALTRSFLSPAEQTIQRYQPPPSPGPVTSPRAYMKETRTCEVTWNTLPLRVLVRRLLSLPLVSTIIYCSFVSCMATFKRVRAYLLVHRIHTISYWENRH